MNLAKNLFICLCMAVIAASLGFSVWAHLGVSGFEAMIVGLGFLALQLVAYLFVWKAIIYRALISRIHDLALAEAENAHGVERISNELHGLKKTLKTIARGELEPLARELEVMGTLIKQLAESATATDGRIQALEERPVAAAPAAAQQSTATPVAEPSPNQPTSPRQTSGSVEAEEISAKEDVAAWISDTQHDDDEALAEVNASVMAAVREAINKNQVDLYLQPIVSLPQRKPMFYEALSRIRSADGELIRPAQFLATAEKSGSMPVIDKMLLVRAIQVLRRLLLRKSDAVVVCNISASSLADSNFFNDFRKLLSVKSDLANHLIFEFDQATVEGFDTLEEESLRSLKNLGFRFAIDNVTNLTMDYQSLVALGFHYVKVAAQTLLAAKKTGINGIHAEDIPRFLSRNGLQLIVDHVETESEVVELLDFDITLGQGFLFAAPREIKADALDNPKRRATDGRLAG